MGRVEAIALALLVCAGCPKESEEPGGCAYWIERLDDPSEAQVAIEAVVEQQCADARASLLAALPSSAVPDDVIQALVALGRSPEAEQAVIFGLALPSARSECAANVARWELAAAREPLEALLFTGPDHVEALLVAALAVGSAAEWAPALTELVERGPLPSVTPALEAFGDMDWSDVSDPTPAVRALARLASGVRADVTPAERTLALVALRRAPSLDPLRLPKVVARISKGDLQAARVGWALARAADVGPALAGALLERRGAPERDPRLPLLAALGAGLPASWRSRLETADGAELLTAAALLDPSAAMPAIETAWQQGRGERRALAARARVLVSPEPTRVLQQMREHASALVREGGEDPRLVSVAGAIDECKDDANCWAARVNSHRGRLPGLGAELDAAREALADAERTATEQTESDRAEAAALAKSDAPEAKASLESIRARQAVRWRAIDAAAAKYRALQAIEWTLIVALGRSIRAPTPAGTAAARAIHEIETAPPLLRRWALAAAGDGRL